MYNPGDTVIVTQDDVNKVGVVIDQYKVNKQTVYDVLLENRSAVCMITSAPKNSTRINRSLTHTLSIDTGGPIDSTIPYKYLVDNELLPVTKS
jgi:microsomal dipeptidase-like Zn-dependent dipeptidase